MQTLKQDVVFFNDMLESKIILHLIYWFDFARLKVNSPRHGHHTFSWDKLIELPQNKSGRSPNIISIWTCWTPCYFDVISLCFLWHGHFKLWRHFIKQSPLVSQQMRDFRKYAKYDI